LAYVESGHLIFARQRTLLAQRFDVEKLELIGEPQVVAQDVAATSYLQRAVFSVSANGTLVHRRNPPRETQLAWFDRSGQRLATVGPAGSLSAPALAPDGRTVAFVRTDPSSRTPDIWLMDVSRGVPTRFTFDAGPSAAPVWSPDGTRVLYVARMRRLVAKSARGGDEEVIADLDVPGAAYANDWSADGRHILFDTRSSSGDLWVLPLDIPRQPRAFVTSQLYHELHQRISPNGRWVAYESDESGSNEIYIRPFDGGRSERVSSSGGIWPQWRRGDGRELYYLAPDGQLMVIDVANGNELKVSAPRPLFTVNAVETDRYSVTADGQKFLMVVPVSNEPLGLTVTVNWPATIGR
jgi:Tol biopolymer transport system component